MCWVPFLLRIVDKLVSLDNKKANLTVNIFPPDHNRTITQISNIIFLLAQTLYLLPELPSVVKYLKKKSWEKSSLTNILLSFIFL